MKRKNIMGLIAIVAIVAAVIFAGCVEEEAPEKIELNVNVFVDNEFWYWYPRMVYLDDVEDTVDEIIEGIILEGKIDYEEILITEWIEDENGVNVTVVFNTRTAPERIELNVNVFVDNEFWYWYPRMVYPDDVEDTVDEIIEGIILEGKIDYEEILITEWIEDENGINVTVVFKGGNTNT